jgi:hypothetical protein
MWPCGIKELLATKPGEFNWDNVWPFIAGFPLQISPAPGRNEI